MIRIALLAAALFAVTAVADDKKPAADEKAMMEAMMKQATPGPEHKKLEPLVGDWTYTAKFWMAPGAPPMEMAGDDKCTWIMDGRFLQDEVTGPAQAGMPPFQGLGLTGYDNTTKKYVGSLDRLDGHGHHADDRRDGRGRQGPHLSLRRIRPDDRQEGQGPTGPPHRRARTTTSWSSTRSCPTART